MEAGMDRDTAEKMVKGMHGILSFSGATRLKNLVKIRSQYESTVHALGDYATNEFAAGKSIDYIARQVSVMRNDLKIEYRKMTPGPVVTIIEQRNIREYGNPLGPSFEQILKKNNENYRGVIKSASRPDGENMGAPVLRALATKFF